MTTKTKRDATEGDIDQLEETRDEIKDLVGEARRIVRGTIEGNAAESYWIPHILGALDDDHDYLGGSMTTMQDTIEALRRDADSDDEEAAR